MAPAKLKAGGPIPAHVIVEQVLKNRLSVEVSTDSSRFSSFLKVKVDLKFDGKTFASSTADIDREDIQNVVGDEDY